MDARSRHVLRAFVLSFSLLLRPSADGFGGQKEEESLKPPPPTNISDHHTMPFHRAAETSCHCILPTPGRGKMGQACLVDVPSGARRFLVLCARARLQPTSTPKKVRVLCVRARCAGVLSSELRTQMLGEVQNSAFDLRTKGGVAFLIPLCLSRPPLYHLPLSSLIFPAPCCITLYFPLAMSRPLFMLELEP